MYQGYRALPRCGGPPYFGQTFSSSGIFLGLQQLNHQKSLKTPNHHPAGCFKHLPVDFSQLSGCLPCWGSVAWHPPGGHPTDPAPLSPKAGEGAWCRGKRQHPLGAAEGRLKFTARCQRLCWDCCGIPVGRLPVGRDVQQEGQVWEGVAVGRVASPRCILMLLVL